MALAVICLIVLAGATVAVATSRAVWRASAVFVVAAIAWLAANKPLEGSILWVASQGHGLTLGDLAIVPGLAIAAARVVAVGLGARRSFTAEIGSGRDVRRDAEAVPDQREARVQR